MVVRNSMPRPLAIGLVLVLSACAGERDQSVLHPVGPAAERIATLWWVMFGVYGVAFVLTLALLAVGLALPRRPRDAGLGRGFVVVAGLVVPTLILVVMLVYTVLITRAGTRDSATFRVEVVGHRWWWAVHYPEHGIVDANELHIPAGEVVELELRSADVVHSFWVPNLAGKLDVLPDHPTVLRIRADRPGTHRGQCAEYCGTQHALMAFHVVAQEPDELRRWLEAKAPPDPTTPQLAHGRRIFLAAGCGECHRIAGVSVGNAGPDLTRIGGRLTLAAGVFANTPENLERWIADPQAMKPGSKMPPTPLRAEHRRALVAYLRSLE